MAAFSLAIKGLADVQRRLAEIARDDQVAFDRALYEEAEIEMTEAKRRVPVDLGALKASGMVSRVEDGVKLSFGDTTVDYAVVVHEDLAAFHDDGTAKYLERPVMEALPHLAARVAARMRRIRGGG